MISNPARPTREQILNNPAARAPPGIEPDFIHPWNMQRRAESFGISLYIVTTIVVLLRVYGQRCVARKFLIEDYVLILAWLVYTGAYVPVGILVARAPIGVHQWNLTLRQYARYLYIQNVGIIIWGVLACLLKVAILLQYLRIFAPDGIRRVMFWASHIVLWANVAFYIAFSFIFIFVCNPRASYWDKTITHGKCLDSFGVNVAGAIFCVVSDLVILLLPQHSIYRLNLPMKRKFGLCILFSIGIFACAASTVRLYYNIRIWKNPYDVTYQIAFVSFWATAQIPAGFFIVCLPSVPKVINQFRGKEWFLHIETSLRTILHLSSPKLNRIPNRRL